MKKVLILFSVFVFCGLLFSGNAPGGGTHENKGGILLPLPALLPRWLRPRGWRAAGRGCGQQKGRARYALGKVQVEGVVADDEAKLDVGVRRYRYMVTEG